MHLEARYIDRYDVRQLSRPLERYRQIIGIFTYNQYIRTHETLERLDIKFGVSNPFTHKVRKKKFAILFCQSHRTCIV